MATCNWRGRKEGDKVSLGEIDGQVCGKFSSFLSLSLFSRLPSRPISSFRRFWGDFLVLSGYTICKERCVENPLFLKAVRGFGRFLNSALFTCLAIIGLSGLSKPGNPVFSPSLDRPQKGSGKGSVQRKHGPVKLSVRIIKQKEKERKRKEREGDLQNLFFPLDLSLPYWQDLIGLKCKRERAKREGEEIGASGELEKKAIFPYRTTFFSSASVKHLFLCQW